MSLSDKRGAFLWTRTTFSKKQRSARTGVTAAKAADAAGKTAASVLSATKLNLQIFDLNTEVEILYKEIGKMVHSEHLGKEEDPAVLQIKLQLIDEKLQKISELQERLHAERSEVFCPNCGKQCKKDDAFCSHCGAQL